jgi:serine/threonine-protein kinase
MKTRRIQTLFILALLFLVAACDGSQTPTASLPTDTALPPTPDVTFQVYERDDYGYRFEYPADWEIVEKPDAQIVLFLSPEGESGSFRENVSVLVQDLGAETVTLEEYTDLALSQAEGLIADYMLIESAPATLAGNPGYTIVYRGTQGVYDVLWLQIWTLVDDRAYVVTYTAEQDFYEQHLALAEQMIDSLELP